MISFNLILIFISVVWFIIIAVFISLMIKSKKSKLSDDDSQMIACIAMAEVQGISLKKEDLRLHQQAGGNINNVVTSMISASMKGEELSFLEACAADLKNTLKE